MTISAHVVQQQKLQSCEIVLQGIQENKAEVIRWFTCEILHFRPPWATVVTLALLDKTKAGEYRWRTAGNPIGLIRTIAKRIALKQYPELLFGNDADKILNPKGRAVSASSYSNDEFDNMLFMAGDYDEGPEEWQMLGFDLESRKNDSLDHDWTEIGRRLELTAAQVRLMEARALGVTRAAMGEYLSWDQTKVEKVWKSVQRVLSKPETAEKARKTLCS